MPVGKSGARVTPLPSTNDTRRGPKAKRPTELTYWVDERPPLPVTALLAVQHLAIVAGAVVALLSRLIHRMRPLLPAELAGLVVFMVGLSVMTLAERQFLGHEVPVGERAGHRAVAILTLAAIVVASVWGGRWLRLFCTLVGIAAGYGASVAGGRIGAEALAGVVAAPLLAVPEVGGFGLAFDAELAPPFLVAALAALKRRGCRHRRLCGGGAAPAPRPPDRAGGAVGTGRRPPPRRLPDRSDRRPRDHHRPPRRLRDHTGVRRVSR